jgi:methionyl-tRNA formyltransferase
MRIVVNGQQAFGRAVLEALLEQSEQVVGVCCAPDRPDRPADPLKAAAAELGLPIVQPASYRDPAAGAAIRELSPDLCVMAYVTQFIPDEVLAIPTLGSIQYHPSLLPRHRGPSSINWPIIAGESLTGVTIFWPDEELDHGPILLQREVAIDPEASLGDVYFEHLFPIGVAAVLEAVALIRQGDAPRIEQDHQQATYEGWCRHEDARIDWRLSADRIANLIRGTDPQPGAWTTINGGVVKMYGARRRQPATPALPGTVTNIDENAVRFAADGGEIEIARVRIDGGPKIAASAAGLRIGDVAGT